MKMIGEITFQKCSKHLYILHQNQKNLDSIEKAVILRIYWVLEAWNKN